MNLKLRANKNKKGQRVWSIYQVFGKYEKLYKRLGPVPRELAETMLRKACIKVLCEEEGIRQNQNISFIQVCDEYLEVKCRPPQKTPTTYKDYTTYTKIIKRVMGRVFAKNNPLKLTKIMIHEINPTVIDSYKVIRNEEGVSNRTINLELVVIRGVLKWKRPSQSTPQKVV